MFCPKCGQAMADGAYFCPNCGADTSAAAKTPATVVQPGGVPAQPQQTSGMAIASLICSLLPFFLVTPIVAIILGHLSLSQIKNSAGRLKGNGLAIAGLVIGYVSFLALVLIVVAITIPNVLRAKIAANESAAMASVRTLSVAEITYSSLHADKGYTCSIGDLKDAGVTDPQLISGTKYGYVFELIECKAEAEGGPNTQYQVIAYPVTIGSTGKRAFCSDQSNVMRYDTSGRGQTCLESGTSME